MIPIIFNILWLLFMLLSAWGYLSQDSANWGPIMTGVGMGMSSTNLLWLFPVKSKTT